MGDGAFAQAARRVPWRVPTNIGESLAKVVEILESFAEAMYYQETRASPDDYLDQWKDMGLLQPVENECWKMPHGSWHRLCAITSVMVQKAIVDLPGLSVERPLTDDQKTAAWADLPQIVP